MVLLCKQCGCVQDTPLAGEDHYMTCPRILTPEVLAVLGFAPKERRTKMPAKKTSKKPVKTNKKH